MKKKELKAWVVCDPYCASGSAMLESFDTEAEADAWLAEQLAADEEGYVGCDVWPRDEAIANYA